MPRCIQCRRYKPSRSFHRSPAWKSGRSSTCASCRSLWRSNSHRYRAQQKRHKRQSILRAREFMWWYLLSHPCPCGEQDPVVLEADHVRGKKYRNVSQLLVNGASPKLLLKELGKCTIRCSNCHARKSAAELGHWKTKMKLHWEDYVVKNQKQEPLRKKTIQKFQYDLDLYLWADRTSYGGIPMDLDFNRIVVKNPKTGQADRDLTIADFSSSLDEWLTERKKQAKKYEQAVLTVFNQYQGRTIGSGQVIQFALFAAELAPTKDNSKIIENAVNQMIEAGKIERMGSRGKGAGLRLLEGQEEAEEEETEEVEEERPSVKNMIPFKKKTRR